MKNVQHFSLKQFQEIIKDIFNSAENSAELFKKWKEVDKTYLISTPMIEKIEADKTIYAAWQMEGKGKSHTVAICRDEEGFCFFCGKIGNSRSASPCNFFSNPLMITTRHSGVALCKHILGVVCNADEDIAQILIPELESDWQYNFGEKEIDKNETDDLAYLKRYSFKVPVLIEGDRGSGKTHDVFQLAKELDIEPAFTGGHAGIESIDLLGSLVPYAGNCLSDSIAKVSAMDLLSGAEPTCTPSQSLVWKDGPVTEAFRKAASGEKAILILDELLRIPQRELNILLTALSPVDGHYILRTGRIISVKEGVAREEIIKAPCGNLFVAATTNVGGQFAVDDIDPALAERFIVIRKDTSQHQLVKILSKYAEDKAFNKAVVIRLKEFFIKMEDAKVQGLVENIPTIRTLSRAIQLADTEAEIWDIIKDQILLWIGRDVEGRPIPEQQDAVIRIMEQSQKIS